MNTNRVVGGGKAEVIVQLMKERQRDSKLRFICAVRVKILFVHARKLYREKESGER